MAKRREYIGIRYYYGMSYGLREWSLSRLQAFKLALKDRILHPGTHVMGGRDWDGNYYYARGYPRKNR